MSSLSRNPYRICPSERHKTPSAWPESSLLASLGGVRSPVSSRQQRRALDGGARPGWGMTDLVIAVRWVALTLALAMSTLDRTYGQVARVGGGLAALALVRTIWPVRLGPEVPTTTGRHWQPVAWAAVEVAVCTAAVGATGWVGSPFVISLGAALFVAGFSLPAWLPGAGAVAAIVATATAGAQGTIDRSLAIRVVERVAVLGTVSLLGSYSHWLLGRGRASTSEEIEHLANLAHVNELLLELHSRAASPPGSLNLTTAVASTVTRLKWLLQPDIVLLLLSEPLDKSARNWTVALVDGVQLPDLVSPEHLCPALVEATRSRGPVSRARLAPGEGVAVESSTGLYVPLWAHQRLVGLIAAERVGNAPPFSEHEADVVEGVARHAGLAIDNARWFHRLRALGAEEERGRIARELHDRIGQSLAYVAFTLDRLASETRSTGHAVDNERALEIDALAATVRQATRQLRTKLSDLRSENSDGALAEVLSGALSRVEERSGIVTSLSSSEEPGLPPKVSHEITQIALEAINNAERHSRARHLYVTWSCHCAYASLEVADDGKGIEAFASLRPDAFGILGMRERAKAIGASLVVQATPGKGTKVALAWGTPGQ